jgi:hypothetical protein
MTWLLNSPEESLAFILADSGFDVWISNTRGTRFSRGHVSLNPTSRVLRFSFNFNTAIFQYEFYPSEFETCYESNNIYESTELKPTIKLLIINKGYFFFFVFLTVMRRATGIGHGMNWWQMISLQFSILFTNRVIRSCTMLATPWYALKF